MRITLPVRAQLIAVVVTLLAGLATIAAVHLRPAAPAHRAGPTSLLCIDGTTQNIHGTWISTPTICIPWI